MLFANKDDINTHLKGIVNFNDKEVKVENSVALRNSTIDDLVYNAVLNPSKEVRGLSRFLIRLIAEELGIILASIQGLYDARGRGECKGFTVPAINIRGMSYELSRAIFRTGEKKNAGAYIFEIAKSEIEYTRQTPAELTAVILSAAIKEGYKGPVFIQGDHFQVNAKKYAENRDKEIGGLKVLIEHAIKAGFYNIDIDTSTLVDLSFDTVEEQQRANYEVGVELTRYIRELEPEGVVISVGGEIGEVGKENSTKEELHAYLDNFNKMLAQAVPGAKGISKISIQTGTSHGGVPLADGSIAEVNLDFDTLETLSQVSRDDYGLAGAVQHGASTLPQDLFDKFPKLETAEIHLATHFQNRIYESDHFPKEFREQIYTHLRKVFANEKKAEMTDEQFIYKTRKKAFGEFKKEFWDLSQEIKDGIGAELEDDVVFLFDKLNIENTRKLIEKTISPCVVPHSLASAVESAE